ncbi:MAG TPA: DUF6246 family protein [Burkholderiaceae bacterium]|nr:DUF6246 family protein [Burkholderiaceae bacterium]
MLVECGLLRVTAGDGTEATFRPSLGRIASLDTPNGLVDLFARLHGPLAHQVAPEILAGLCDPEDCEALSSLIGEPEPAPQGVEWRGGAIPPSERVILARHLMLHGMVGKAKPGGESKAERGDYSGAFHALEYITAARVHLGMSAEEAEALSMTEFQRLFEMKFPEKDQPGYADAPTREEYEAGMRAFEELKRRRAEGMADHG